MTIDRRKDSRTTGLRVLVVEDESLIAILIEGMLEDLGHTVVGMAPNLGKALELAQLDGLDVAILDVNVDGQESYPVADALAARRVPVVFATGYAASRLRAPYGDAFVLQKPFVQRDLQAAIGTVCR